MAIVERPRIKQVIRCGSWQAFRIALKGTDTRTKLDLLALYLSADDACQHNRADGQRGYTPEEGWLASLQIKPKQNIEHWNASICDWPARRDQVLNYLTALSRGGQIEPLVEKVYFDAIVYDKDRKYGDIKFDLIVIRR